MTSPYPVRVTRGASRSFEASTSRDPPGRPALGPRPDRQQGVLRRGRGPAPRWSSAGRWTRFWCSRSRPTAWTSPRCEGLESGEGPEPAAGRVHGDGRHPVRPRIPGMVMAAQALLAENPHPRPDEVREGLAGNLCRCAGYQRIVDAVLLTAGEAPARPRARSCRRDRAPDWRSARRVGGIGARDRTAAVRGDVRLDNVLHVKLVTLDCARTRSSIDTSEAEQLPGVRVVVTAADLPDPMPRFGPVNRSGSVLAVARPSTTGSRWPPSRPRPRRPPTPPSRSCGSPLRSSARPTVDQALYPDAPLVQDP